MLEYAYVFPLISYKGKGGTSWLFFPFLCYEQKDPLFFFKFILDMLTNIAHSSESTYFGLD